MAIEIETSTDSVEQVKAAMGLGVEIDESPAEPDDADSDEDGDEESEEESDEDSSDDSDGESDEDEDESDDGASSEGKNKPAAKPAKRSNGQPDREKKGPPDQISYKRFREVVKQRDSARTALEEVVRRPAAAASSASDKETTAATKPKTFSGEAEPTLEQFTASIDQFDSAAMAKASADYAKAISTWTRKEVQAETTFNQRQADMARESQLLVDNLKKNAKEAVKRLPDYEEVVQGATDVNISAAMTKVICRSSVGPDMLYYLAQHPDEAADITALSVDEQVAEIKDLERDILNELGEQPTTKKTGATGPPRKTPSKKTVSKAPEPPSRLRPTTSGVKTMRELAGTDARNGVDIDFNPEYEAAVNAKKTARK